MQGRIAISSPTRARRSSTSRTSGTTITATPTHHALRQIGTHVHIPAKYLDRMSTQAPALLAANVNHCFKDNPVPRMLCTKINGLTSLRAFLSNRYHPLDNHDLAQAVLPLLLARALELFAPVQRSDCVGLNGGSVGPKGQDESVLAGYEIVDDPLGPKNAAPTADEDGSVCLHTEIEPYEDEAIRGACIECGEEFEINARVSEPNIAAESEADEPEPEAVPV